MNFKASPEKPYVFSFAVIISWFIVSKAFERSINNADSHSPLSIALFYFSKINAAPHVMF